MPFEKLDRSLVPLGGCTGFERAEVSASSGSRISLL